MKFDDVAPFTLCSTAHGLDVEDYLLDLCVTGEKQQNIVVFFILIEDFSYNGGGHLIQLFVGDRTLLALVDLTPANADRHLRELLQCFEVVDLLSETSFVGYADLRARLTAFHELLSQVSRDFPVLLILRAGHLSLSPWLHFLEPLNVKVLLVQESVDMIFGEVLLK